MHVLDDPRYRVPGVPPATRGVAWLRANVARFSEGDDHLRRRALVEELVANIAVDRVRRPGSPVANLAAALGLQADSAVVADVASVARSYQPHAPQHEESDVALGRLVERFGGWDEPTAALIGLLVQACDATRAMIAGAEPPVPHTRRVGPDGDVVLVDLADEPFGAGHHRCPGRDLALAMVEGARAFRRLHAGPAPLVLPNAWDCASAAAFVAAGFEAIGTTSLGVAAANGLPDAAGATLEATLELAHRLAPLPVPVTVDIEAGFGVDPATLAAELSAIGIAGVNVEDGRGTSLADAVEQAAIVTALKTGAPELFVNARVDTYWSGRAPHETLDRAQRYVDSGADGVFVPGLSDPATIEHLANELTVPLNVLAHLPLRQLTELGVRRVSTGSLLFRVGIDAAVDAARRVSAGDVVATRTTYAEVAG